MISRRRMLGYIACIGLGAPLVAWSKDPVEEESYHDPQAAEKWMRHLFEEAERKELGINKAAVNPLLVGRFSDPTYYTTSIIGWDPSASQASAYKPVRVPIGFVTDFASIPRVFWSVLRPDGNYAYAAVVHDYLYWEQYLPRQTADETFKFLMEDFKINSVVVKTIYNVVRLGGSAAWENNAQLKAAGEKRILKKFPTDPTVRWEDWKNIQGVL